MLDYISAFSILIPTVTALYKFRLLSTELKLLGLLFTFGTVIELLGYIQFSRHLNTVWIINLYVLIEAAVYFYVIGSWFNSGRLFRITMLLFAIYSIVWFYTSFISGSFLELNNKEITLKGILLIILSGYTLIRIGAEDSFMMTKDYRFWILSAMLIYFSITEVVFATANFVLENEPVIRSAWAIHSIINIISNLLFAIGFACSYRRMNFSG